MLVRNLYNEMTKLPSDIKYSSYVGYELDLIPGDYYVVYGMTIKENYIWYYICDETCSGDFPIWNPSPAFEIVCNKLSRYWKYSFKEKHKRSVMAFPEWADNPYDYYDRLTDWEEKEVEIFRKYKKLMDLEFPTPAITINADIGDDEWLLCPLCIDAWNSKISRDALVICPKCKTTMNNPRYKNSNLFL